MTEAWKYSNALLRVPMEVAAIALSGERDSVALGVGIHPAAASEGRPEPQLPSEFSAVEPVNLDVKAPDGTVAPIIVVDNRGAYL